MSFYYLKNLNNINIEYLLFLSKNKKDLEIVDASSIDINEVVTASHETLDKEQGNE